MTAHAMVKPAATDADRGAISALIKTYLDGLYEGNAEKLASAFHSTSALAQTVDGKLQVTPRDTWLEAVRNRPSPQSKNLGRHDEILSIDIAGPTMAFVKLRCAIPPRYFTDYLTLLKLRDGWRVVSKTFRTEVRA